MLASWNIDERVPIYFALVLFLQAGLFGTFTALNFFHWFIFWELSLIPAFFLIRLWGGPLRSSAATQFFLYTMAGSVALLLAFLAIYLSTGKFDFTELADMGRNGTLTSALSAELGWRSLNSKPLSLIIFTGAFLGFAVKVPLYPFHTWLPPAYAEAPTGTTMLLTGAMSKMGVYGFLRILLPIFPEQMHWILTPLLWLAVISIVFSASAAFAQRDLKRMLAYSSISHLGYCLLGIFVIAKFTGIDAPSATAKSAALNGVFLQMFNHGLTASALFWFVGLLEQRSGGLRGLDDFGGLRKVAPVFCGMMGIALFSSLGLPGLNGFVGEFLIFRGAFPLVTWATALSTLGLLLTAVFILTILQRVFHGPLNQAWSKMPDLTLKERLILLPAIALMFVLGIYPQLVLGVINSTVVQMVRERTF
jgi:NADH-quinone oxidoreductase subunit M